MTKRRKPTTVEKTHRVSVVFDLLTMGSSRAEILQYIAEKTPWSVSERTVDHYIQAATEGFQQLAEYDRQEQVGRAIRRLEMLFLKAMKVQDYARALAAQRELNKLLGLYEPTQHDFTSDGKPLTIAVVKMDIDEL